MNSLLLNKTPSEDQKNPPSSHPPAERQSPRKMRQFTSTIWTSCHNDGVGSFTAVLSLGLFSSSLLQDGKDVRCKSEDHVPIVAVSE